MRIRLTTARAMFTSFLLFSFLILINTQITLGYPDPIISDFFPKQGYFGTMVEIRGKNLKVDGLQTEVTINNKPVMVVQAGSSFLKIIISDLSITSGPIKVRVGNSAAISSSNFTVLKREISREKIDGPPVFLKGKGLGLPTNVLSKGKVKILVVLVHPTDQAPVDPAEARALIEKQWTDAREFYRQASFQRLELDIKITNNYHVLTGDYDDYIADGAPPCGGDPGGIPIMEASPGGIPIMEASPGGDSGAPNIRCDVLNRLVAEAAQAAISESINLNDFDIMACSFNLNDPNNIIRGLGGWSQQQFIHDNINIELDHELHLIALGGTSDSMHIGHELGHIFVSLPPGLNAPVGSPLLSEDIYAGDGISSEDASAQRFDLMGWHYDGPIFSGYNMHKLGYYASINIADLKWSSINGQEYDLVAHGPGPQAGVYPWHYNLKTPGPTENTISKRYHLLRIRITEALSYYVEVREQPDTGGLYQIFDKNIPYQKSSSIFNPTEPGGVVVTRVVTGEVINEQDKRFITLSHPASRTGIHTLKQGEFAIGDFNLKVSVVDDNVANDPLACRVKVELERKDSSSLVEPFDLRLEQKDGSWQSPGLWVDVPPYIYPVVGRELPAGERPRAGEPNRVWTRVYNDGSYDAKEVKVNFYAIDPPGGGNSQKENLIGTRTFSLKADSYRDVFITWTPEDNLPAALKAVVVPQNLEITNTNNSTQENIFQLESVAINPTDIPAPITLPVVIRNPIIPGPTASKHPVFLDVKDVPDGYAVHVPNSIIWLAPQEERRINVTVIPTYSYNRYSSGETKSSRVRLVWSVPVVYRSEMQMAALGGVTAHVTPKQSVSMVLRYDPTSSSQTTIVVTGNIDPMLAGETLRVDLIDPQGRRRVKEVKTGSYGRFSATFDLTLAPSLNAEPDPDNTETPLHGIYKAQAFIINSPSAAQAESNIVYISK